MREGGRGRGREGGRGGGSEGGREGGRGGGSEGGREEGRDIFIQCLCEGSTLNTAPHTYMLHMH